MADPNALTQALAGWETYERLGSPEGELAIAQVVIYLGTAPKSNAIYTAYSAARASAKATGSLMPPSHILNAPTRLMKDLGYGAGYQYDHETEEAFSGQNYFPDGMAREQFYRPRDRGFEREISKRLEVLGEAAGGTEPTRHIELCRVAPPSLISAGGTGAGTARTGGPLRVSGSGSRHAMKRAQLVAVRIAQVSKIHCTGAALSNAGRVLDRFPPFAIPALCQASAWSWFAIVKPIVPPLACVAALPSIGGLTRKTPPLCA